MTVLEQEIVELYEGADMSVEEIATEVGGGDMEPLAVKSILMQYSGKFRRGEVKTGEDNIKSREREELLNAIKDLARNNEVDNPAVAMRGYLYLHEELTDRNEARAKKHENSSGRVNINVIQINEAIKKAKQVAGSVNRIKALPKPVEIDA